MLLIPNLFLQGGKVVSLYKGTDNAEKKAYPKAPKSYVEFFEKQGAKTLFIVDLNGNQRHRLPEFRKIFSGELWWAGQVREEESIAELLKNGTDRVVLGQGAEAIFESALKNFGPQKLIAGIQSFHYEEAPTLCERYVQMGFTDIVVKDMNAEGTLFHPNYDLMEKCVYFSRARIHASGGIGEEHDLQLLKEAKVTSAIIGRALIEHQLNLVDLRDRFGDE